jgi:hypothetical protein
LYLSVFVISADQIIAGSGPCIRVEKRLAACTGTSVADCIWIHYAHVEGDSLLSEGAPPYLPIRVPCRAFPEKPTKLPSTGPVEPENLLCSLPAWHMVPF